MAVSAMPGAAVRRPGAPWSRQHCSRPASRLACLADRTLGKAPAEPPAYRRLTFDRGTLGHARFAPDGNTIVYDAAWRGEPSEVFTTRIDSRESRSLGLSMALSMRSPPRASWRWVSARSGPVLRPPSAVCRSPVERRARFSSASPGRTGLPTARTSPWFAPVDGVDRLEFPIGKLLYESRGTISHARVSPEETGSPSSTTQTRSWASPRAPSSRSTGQVRKKTLSTGWADLYGLAWRPDGREVWFTAARRNEFKALRAVTLAGEERLVTRVMGQLDLEDVSRSGRVLVGHPNFRIRHGRAGPRRIEGARAHLAGAVQVADLSKDGSRVLFTELPEGAGEGGSTYLRPTDGSPAVRLGDGVAQALSPDGKWALSLLTSPSRLILLPTGAGQVRDLTRPGLIYVGAAGFPTAARVLFAAEGQGGHQGLRAGRRRR